MAQFYGEICGNRGPASRMGGKESGFQAHIRGWKVGIELNLQYNESTGKDEIAVFLTGGSKRVVKDKLIGIFTDRGRRIRRNLKAQKKLLKKRQIRLGTPRTVEAE